MALRPTNDNQGYTPLFLGGNHLTIVGGGTNSVGIQALASSTYDNGGMLDPESDTGEDFTGQIENSIVPPPAAGGPATSFDVEQDHGETAVLTTRYSNYDPLTQLTSGGAQIQPTNQTNLSPGFVSTTDFHLAPTSQLIDVGDPVVGGPLNDLDGLPRVVNGRRASGLCLVRRDLGAYELHPATPPDCHRPNTTFSKKPHKKTHQRKVTFRFRSSEAGSTFRCKIDKHSYKTCSATKKFSVRKGKHTVYAVAKDAAGNSDSSPAKFKFRRL